ncbi:SRS domain-containing protein [Neospora caninum Liverpool]|uniref:SRS domain-containing protein n=1 Tax=Neospora caninum (strain Liverpool) TaxID=572307 RepID=F0VMF9_NEOCL|nr:SRS domain-containing protein [Neospora caninum Liverpool]CBZ54905.1 SRS domain-containing protein [Neospora caninum Liverpool]CEL69626.1 TPA: SRS domain-containing protein [Neospora caninum Liverpool]|eukprot:XP_003884933.1 SRS domain-containing protein [Neospora caninum Liverpool]
MTDPTTCVSPLGTIPLAGLLKGDGASDVHWKPDFVNHAVVLTVPPKNLPPVDKKFIVGCTEVAQGYCLLHITLSAGTSSTDNQSVSCAYGSASNEQVQKVTITPKNPTFTLNCSTDGTMQPTSFTTNYCADADTVQDDCTQKYASLLDGYSKTWWHVSQTQTSNQATLTIPADKFPEAETKLGLGCKATTPLSNSTTCKVELTITRNNSSSVWRLSLSVTAFLALTGALPFLM